MQQKPKVIPYCLLFLLFLLSGCSSLSLPSLPWSTPAAQPNATAEALFDEGMTYLNNKKYVLAIDRFQRVKAEFPFSPQLTEAELKLAEAYYLNKQYPEAAAAFKEFQTLHPTNENIPFVLYHLGLVHFEQFTSNDRYQKTTETAKNYFETVVKNYPNSPYAAPAKEKLAKCLEYLSEYEFNIATFYFNEKKYPAAIDRLEGILRSYRGTPIAAKALYYLGESYRLEKNNVKATLAYEAMVQYYPDNPLTKNAQIQLSDLAKEKQDPLAMLLKRDGRPTYAPPPPVSSKQKGEGGQRSAVGGQPESGAIQNPKSKIQNPQELNLVAKKEVVHEEPGDDKGMFRRVIDTLNPFSSSSSDKKDDGSRKGEGAQAATDTKAESKGFFSSLWGGSGAASEESAKVAGANGPQLDKIDQSLNQKGIDTSAQNLAARPPAANLPKVEEAAPPPSNTAELLGSVDANLKKEGKNVAELPSPPEPAPFFKVPNTGEQKAATPRSQTASSHATKGLVAGIDEALRRKGIEPAKLETTEKSGESKAEGQSSTPLPTVSKQEKIELAPKLTVEKGPLFLDKGEYQAQEKAKQDQSSEPVVAAPPKGAEPSKELPQAVVKGPPQPVQEKAAETKVAEQKKSPDEEEEPKGTLEQLKEDVGRLRDLLNPFGW